MKSVYVAGPITKGDQFVNVRNAIFAAERLRKAGFLPYVPHLSFAWHMLSPVDYESWITMGFYWLSKCDYLVRLDGESDGADREVVFAHENRIPVFNGVNELFGFQSASTGSDVGMPGIAMPYSDEASPPIRHVHGMSSDGEPVGTMAPACEGEYAWARIEQIAGDLTFGRIGSDGWACRLANLLGKGSTAFAAFLDLVRQIDEAEAQRGNLRKE